jgi:nucleotidyltransferase substrate binding protein (TIGR01987 family)
MQIDTCYLEKCIRALQTAYEHMMNVSEDDIMYDIYRAAIIKEFEISLEQSGKLLKKALKPYFHSSKAVDQLFFKDIFREAGLHSLLSIEEVERWLVYRDNRNSTAHDYGEAMANETLALMPMFIEDVTSLIKIINTHDT